MTTIFDLERRIANVERQLSNSSAYGPNNLPPSGYTCTTTASIYPGQYYLRLQPQREFRPEWLALWSPSGCYSLRSSYVRVGTYIIWDGASPITTDGLLIRFQPQIPTNPAVGIDMAVTYDLRDAPGPIILLATCGGSIVEPDPVPLSLGSRLQG